MAQHMGEKRWLAVGVAVVAGVVALLAARRGAPDIRTVTRRNAEAEPEPTVQTLWSCGCGQRLRTVGTGRHQVHWLVDAPEGEPLLDGACPTCGRILVLAA
jgi:hypothetical protein